MLGYEGFIYTLDRQTDAEMVFRCQNSQSPPYSSRRIMKSN